MIILQQLSHKPFQFSKNSNSQTHSYTIDHTYCLQSYIHCSYIVHHTLLQSYILEKSKTWQIHKSRTIISVTIPNIQKKNSSTKNQNFIRNYYLKNIIFIIQKSQIFLLDIILHTFFHTNLITRK